MKKLSFGFLFPLLTLILLVFLLGQQVFQIPALGKFLNPFIGVVQNEKSQKTNLQLDFQNRDIEIVFGKRGVAHVFADKQEDLMFAQGYVTASDRLWQMDFLSDVSAGRLSEIFGAAYLTYDRMQRRVGMLQSARQSLIYIESNPETKLALDNYTQGVNCYIAGLDKSEIPFEYKLMDYHPEPWTNLKSVLVMKYMSSLLTGYEEDVSASHMLLALGEQDYKKLYPDYKLSLDNQDHLQLNLLTDSLPYHNYIDYSFLTNTPIINQSEFNPRLGSNSWAISSKKSKSGNAILCNDPHLNLSFPSIWYEIQLCSEDMNVYGVSIPGTPGVIIGFNEDISWGVTNGATDVRDWYKLEITEDYSRYKLDDHWQEMEMLVEEVKIKGQQSFIDTIYHTIHGPIVIDNAYNQTPEVKNYALKWTLHEPTNEFLAFLNLNKAKNYDQFVEAIQHYKCPVQNFTYADIHGEIALHHQGNIYKKWSGQGKFILDGSKSAHIPGEYLGNELPVVNNPDCGFVYSANNNLFESVDSSFVNGYYSELRADKIRSYLSSKDQFEIQDMKIMQLDNTNRLAELALPILLQLMTAEKSDMIELFNRWDYTCSKESYTALLFEEWWELIEYYTWDELYRSPGFLRAPDDLVLLNLIKNKPDNKFFDISGTEHKESAKMIVIKAYKELQELYQNKETVAWGDTNKVNINHLSNLEALGIQNISTGGHPDALNAISSNWGPSWRMIVEMSSPPKAYGIYAGGQSGNPGAEQYDNFMKDWEMGNYYELEFFTSKKEAEQQEQYKWESK